MLWSLAACPHLANLALGIEFGNNLHYSIISIICLVKSCIAKSMLKLVATFLLKFFL